jgi:arylacetamide deacetylase
MIQIYRSCTVCCLFCRYRRVPEYNFPAALDDCTSITYELFRHADRYRIDPERIILTGDSAGGNLALVLTQSLINDGFHPRSACLIYPALQFFDFTLPSYRLYLPRNILGVINEDNFLSVMSKLSSDKVIVTRDIFFNNHTSAKDKKRLRPYIDAAKFLPISLPFDIDQEGNEDLIHHLNFLISPKMSPLLVPDDELLKLPSILLFTTEFDILRDEGKMIES